MFSFISFDERKENETKMYMSALKKSNKYMRAQIGPDSLYENYFATKTNLFRKTKNAFSLLILPYVTGR